MMITTRASMITIMVGGPGDDLDLRYGPEATMITSPRVVVRMDPPPLSGDRQQTAVGVLETEW